MECFEETLHRHRKEKKELQAKIQALKKSATKGDKKKKREVSEKIIELEAEIGKRHQEELSQCNTETEVEQEQETSEIKDEDEAAAGEILKGNEKGRVTKAQRRRDKKEEKKKEREKLISEQEEENRTGARAIEIDAIKAVLKEKGLMIKEIPSDGNCLYKAVDEEVGRVMGWKKGIDWLRKLAANGMRTRMKELIPFLTHPDTGDRFEENEYLEYCDQVENTNSWGGHIELEALAEALHCQIEVVQGSGPGVDIGQDGPLLTLCYHRHMYGLGEHYNAVKTYEEEKNGEFIGDVDSD